MREHLTMEAFEEAILTGGKAPSLHELDEGSILAREPTYGNSLLHLSAYTDNVSWLSTLLSLRSVEVNVRNNHGETALHWAAKMNSIEAAGLLANAGADLDARDQSDSCPLHVAAGQGHPEMVMLLLNRHCNAHAVDADGSSSLTAARQQMQKLDHARKDKDDGPAPLSSHNAFMSTITILQRHVSQTTADGTLMGSQVRGRTATVGGAGGQSAPSYSYMRAGSSSRSPSPPAAKTGRARRIDPEADLPKPAFYIPKVEYAPVFFITSSDSAGAPPIVASAKKHRRPASAGTNASGSGGAADISRASSSSPPRQPLAYAQGRGPESPKIRSKAVISPTKTAFLGHLSLSSSALYQAAVKLDPVGQQQQRQLRSQSPGARARGTSLHGRSTDDDHAAVPMPFIIRSPALRSELDCVVAVQHCWGCEQHSSYCRHDSAKYVQQANLAIAAVCEALLMQRLPVRLIAYKVRTGARETARMGALEVTVGIWFVNRTFQNTTPVVARYPTMGTTATTATNSNAGAGAGAGAKGLEWKSAVLHSKLKTGCWPVVAGVKHAAGLFAASTLREAGYNLPQPMPPQVAVQVQVPPASGAVKGEGERSKPFAFLENESDDEDGAHKQVVKRPSFLYNHPSTPSRAQSPSPSPSPLPSLEEDAHTPRIKRPQSMFNMSSGFRSIADSKGKARPVALDEKIKACFDLWIARMKFASKDQKNHSSTLPSTNSTTVPQLQANPHVLNRGTSEAALSHDNKAKHPTPQGGPEQTDSEELRQGPPGSSPSEALSIHTKRSTFAGFAPTWPPPVVPKPDSLLRNSSAFALQTRGTVAAPSGAAAAAGSTLVPIPPPFVLEKLNAAVWEKPKESHLASEAPARAYGYRRGTFFGYPRSLSLPLSQPSADLAAVADNDTIGVVASANQPGSPPAKLRHFASTNTIPTSTASATAAAFATDKPTMSDLELFESLVIKHFLVFDARSSHDTSSNNS